MLTCGTQARADYSMPEALDYSHLQDASDSIGEATLQVTCKMQATAYMTFL